MLLKRIEAKTLQQALDRVRAECGEDALLVETRPTRSGYLVVAARAETALPPARARVPMSTHRRWTRGFQPLAQKASEFGLSQRLLVAVEDALIGTRVNLTEEGDPALQRLCARIFAALIQIDDRCERPHSGGGAPALAVVGPTGVGKTTTLAKLAARAVAAGEDIAILTLDTYRVAAVEQLRAFADLLDVPIEVLFTPQDLRRALQRHSGQRRVFLDTTGRSPLDRDAIAALHGTLSCGPISTLLCLAAGTRRRDCELVLDTYDALGIDAVAITKWDETMMPGDALSAVVERGLPISHVTVGQEVPADILRADAGQLAAAVFDLETHAVEGRA
jgi:flagellar biosynthesis GTPase FlhF